MTLAIAPSADIEHKPTCTIIRDIDVALTILQTEKRIALDLETSGFSPFKDKIAVVSLYGKETDTAAILHIRGDMPDNLRNFLGSGRNWIVHNGVGFDLLFLANNGVNIWGEKYYDTMIGEQTTLTSGRANVSKSLKNSLKRRLAKEIDKSEQQSSWMHHTLNPSQVHYCVQDVAFLHRLRNEQIAKCQTDTRIHALQMEMELILIIVALELNGLPIDMESLHEYLEASERRTSELLPQIADMCGVPQNSFNLNSPIQVKKMLHKAGYLVADTAKDTLMILDTFSDTPLESIFYKIVQARRGLKRSTMYDMDWQTEHIVWKNGMPYICARFNQTSTDTMRFSSSDPNLQQMPQDMRYVVKAHQNYKMVWADYSQLEAWIAAGLANDTAYLHGLQTGDIHSAVASKIYKIPLEDFLALQEKDPKKFKNMRKNGKFCNFLLLFGGGASGLRDYALAAGSMMSIDEAENIVETFHSSYTGLAAARQFATNWANRHSFCTITLPNGSKRVLGGKLAATQILNTNVQGTAAIGLKYALLESAKRGLIKYMGATVHDELVAHVPANEALEYAAELKDAMQVGMNRAIKLPIVAESKIGDNWG